MTGRSPRFLLVHTQGTVELFCRPQGSVYVYAKNATTGDFGLTQIDEWHGAGHPLAW